MNIKPLHDRLLVKREEVEQQTASGILISGAAKESHDIGSVVVLGSKVSLVTVGERVLFGKFAGQSVKYEGQDFLILREDEVIAVLED